MFINLNDLKIFFEIHGQGEAVILLHHGFGSSKMWKDIYPALNEKGYQTIMYDRRGYGNLDEGNDFEEFYRSENFRAECVQELES